MSCNSCCLLSRREDLIKPACKQRVKHIMELAASDMRFDVPLNNACVEERKALCGDVEPGHGRIVRCLQTRYVVFLLVHAQAWWLTRRRHPAMSSIQAFMSASDEEALRREAF